MKAHPLVTYLDRTGEKLYAFADRIGVQGTSLARAVAGERGLSLEAALLVERETGGEVPAESWLREPLPKSRKPHAA